MIIVKVPYRVSFVGGGTDFKSFFKKKKSIVVNSTINKYLYIIFSENPIDAPKKHKFSYSKIEEVDHIDNLKHPLFRYFFKDKIFKNLSINLSIKNDMAYSSGLGGSSALTVGLIIIKNYLYKKKYSKEKIFKEAVNIERNILKEYGGVQDQAACAFGGFNKFLFHKNNIKNQSISLKKTSNISKNLYLMYVSSNINSSKIHKNIKKNINPFLVSEIDNVNKFLKIIDKTKFSLDEFNQIFKTNRSLKNKINNNSYNKQIIQIFEKLLKMKIYNFKLCGSGGRGYILILEEKQKILSFMKKYNYNITKIELTNENAKLVKLD